MPNWCWTFYVVEGKKEEVGDLYDKIGSLANAKDPLVKNGFGKMWLGCLVNALGGNWKDVYCRGELTDWSRDSETQVRFSVMSAWAELDEMRKFLKWKYPSLNFYFQSEEPGMVVYETNDTEGRHFPERIKVENLEDGSEYFETWEDAYDHISEITKTPVASGREMSDAVEAYNEAHSDGGIYVHEFQIVE